VKNVQRKYFLCAAMLLAFGATGFAIPRVLAKSAAPQSQASPGPEMERLIKFYRGTWDYREIYAKSPQMPNGGENTGVYTSELGPGGNSIVNRFHSKGPVGDFQGLLVMTWDPREKAYKMYLFSGDAPGAIVETGQFEGDALIYRTTLTMGNQTISIRNETRVDAKGVLTGDQFFISGAPTGKETPFVHVIATRRP